MICHTAHTHVPCATTMLACFDLDGGCQPPAQVQLQQLGCPANQTWSCSGSVAYMTKLAAWTMILSHRTRTTSMQQSCSPAALAGNALPVQNQHEHAPLKVKFGCAGRARLLLLPRESLVQQTDWLTPRLLRLPWRQLGPGMQTRLCCDSLSGLTPPEMAYPVAPWPRCRLQLCR